MIFFKLRSVIKELRLFSLFNSKESMSHQWCSILDSLFQLTWAESVCKLFHFSSRMYVNFNKSILGKRGFKCLNEGSYRFPNGNNCESLKILSFRTARPISTKHVMTKASQVGGINIFSNEWKSLPPKGDNYELVIFTKNLYHWANILIILKNCVFFPNSQFQLHS